MACCGRATVSVHPNPELPSGAARHPERRDGPLPPGPHLRFEYVGRTAVTVFGPYSGRCYRFPYPGAQITVEAVDGPSLAAVPNLRRVRMRTAPA